MPRTRLDLLLVERKLAESRAKAQALVMAGQVRVDGQMVFKPATSVDAKASVDVDSGPRYVSRGGEKLEAALEAFPIIVSGRTCADVGASTGGFSDCLLQNGATKIYAIDVGKGILHWKLRNDSRVVVMEETNARYVESLPESVNLVVCDASFISLKILLPVMAKWFFPSLPPDLPEGEGSLRQGEGKLPPSDSPHLTEAGGEIIALIKPQFEAGRKESAKHKGVIRDPEIHRSILFDILAFAESIGLTVRGLARSPILGPKGNVEFLVWLQSGKEKSDLELLVNEVLPKEEE